MDLPHRSTLFGYQEGVGSAHIDKGSCGVLIPDFCFIAFQLDTVLWLSGCSAPTLAITFHSLYLISTLEDSKALQVLIVEAIHQWQLLCF